VLKRALGLSFAAGVFISIGGAVFLSCDNKYLGAVFFCVALLSICMLGLFLFTGKVGYLVHDHSGKAFLELGLTLLGNLLGTLICALLLSYAKPALRAEAIARCAPRLEMAPMQVLIMAFFCGILMYTAVAIYKEKQSPLGVFFCVPVFILSGFEHSIADMFYFFTAGEFGGETWLFLALAVLGNSLGGVLVPAIRELTGEKAHV